ncbi:hypothetical protein [Streptomyces cadmiisoli]|uniref:hypothetical protein n=1 Tax=Streptomyces cadmiisoli TaxID=2184053 RepID=UPI003D7226EE
MLALRLTRAAHPAVQLRRLLVSAASAGTGFLLLCTLGHAMSNPAAPAASVLRLAWCAAPLVATVHFAVAVARTDPGTRPRSGLSAIGLGPARMMAVSATTTALSTVLGSMLALLFFLHLRGDITGMPFDGAAAAFLAAGTPLPLPAALTLLALVPAAACLSVALVLRPRDPRPAPRGGTRTGLGRFGRAGTRETFGAYGRFGSRLRRTAHGGSGRATATADAGTLAAGTALLPDEESTAQEPDGTADPFSALTPPADTDRPDPTAVLPWSVAVVAAGLAAEAYAVRTTTGGLAMPGGLAAGPVGVLVGWVLAAVGLALAGPGLTHLCGRLLQAVHPGAVRLLAGRVLMEESARIGRPLGIVCAVASAAYAMAALQDPDTAPLGPLTALGYCLVAGCALATLLTAAVETRQARAATTAALLRLGAPNTMLRGAAALRAGVLLAVFGPLTVLVAELAARPLGR